MPEQTAETHAEAIKREYSKYEATELILIGGVPAFAKGDRVPAGHVDGFDRPTVDENGHYDGGTEHIDPVVHADYVKRVTAPPAKKAAAPAAAQKES